MYRFIISNAELGITTAKRWSSQNETAVRFLYPTFKRQPLYVLIGFMLLATMMTLPFITAIVLSIYGEFNLMSIVALAASLLLMVSYVLVVYRTHPRTWWLTLFFFPLALLQELVLLVASMVSYEFGDVNWKGRNVCYPVVSSVQQPKDR